MITFFGVVLQNENAFANTIFISTTKLAIHSFLSPIMARNVWAER